MEQTPFPKRHNIWKEMQGGIGVKKSIYFLLLLAALCCLALSAGAEQMPDYYSLYQAAKEAGNEAAMAQIRADMPNGLYRFRDRKTGLWGYINFLGEWAIQPQFDGAGVFRGDYAAACEPCEDEDDEDYHEGVIDRNGNWVVEPHYFVDRGYDGWYYGGLTLGYYEMWDNDTDKSGFFDVPSGYFSGLVYDGELNFWNGSRLVPVSLNGRQCYVDRSTGEVAFFLPEGLMADPMIQEDSEFVDGFAKVYRDDGRDAWHWFDEKSGAFILNERGEVQDLSGVVFYGAEAQLLGVLTPGGLLLAWDRETGLYGYYDLNAMDWRVPPTYEAADDFSYSGYACVWLSEGNFGHIDAQGNLLASGFGEWYSFLGDYAYLREANILINAAGETVISFPEGCELCDQWDDEMRNGYDYYVSPDGLMEVYDRNAGGYGVMNLQGEWVLPPEEGQNLWSGEETFSPEGWRFFSEGLQAVSRRGEAKTRTVTLADGTEQEKTYYDRKIGYVNTKGETVIDFQYDDAGAFLNGLAWVERDGKWGYVDAYGREILWDRETENTAR